MNKELQALTAGLRTRGESAQTEINAVMSTLHVQFPTDYVEFMRAFDGGTGPVGDEGFLNIWPVAKLVELNEASGVADEVPGLVLFGSDGGNTGYAFDQRASEMQIVSIPLDVLDLEHVKPYGRSLVEFVRRLAAEGAG